MATFAEKISAIRAVAESTGLTVFDSGLDLDVEAYCLVLIGDPVARPQIDPAKLRAAIAARFSNENQP